MGFKLTYLEVIVIGIDHTGNCKSNYHSMTAPSVIGKKYLKIV